MHETWLYHYDPEKSNNQWSGGITAHTAPKNSEHWKSSRFDFWDQDGMLVQLKNILKEKRCKKVTKGVSFLHDNAPAHGALATQKKLACLGFHFLDHPPYSPDLAPSDYHSFPGLKKKLKVHNFSSDAEVIAAAETWLDGQHSEYSLSGFRKLEQRVKKCNELRGEYVE